MKAYLRIAIAIIGAAISIVPGSAIPAGHVDSTPQEVFDSNA